MLGTLFGREKSFIIVTRETIKASETLVNIYYFHGALYQKTVIFNTDMFILRTLFQYFQYLSQCDQKYMRYN
jgi:hypothetical protein